jgi:hypothetical protein
MAAPQGWVDLLLALSLVAASDVIDVRHGMASQVPDAHP